MRRWGVVTACLLIAGASLMCLAGFTGYAILFLPPGMGLCFLAFWVCWGRVAPGCQTRSGRAFAYVVAILAIPIGAVFVRVGYVYYGFHLGRDLSAYERKVKQLDSELRGPGSIIQEAPSPGWRRVRADRNSAGELSVCFLTGPRRGVAYHSGADPKSSNLPSVRMREIKSKRGWYYF